MRWQVMWQCSALIGFLQSVLATEFCMECRPSELQRAPGLGIDLSMSHGTAAMKFRNGTILDLVQLPGSPEYVSVMKTLAEDALRVRAGERSSYLSVLEYEPGRPISFVELLSSPSVSRLYQYLTHQVQPSPHESHPLVREITAMLSALKTAVQEKQSLLYPLLIISIPDFEADTHHIYKSFFKNLAQRVGFNLLYSPMLASLRALEFYGIDDCWGSPLSPEPPCPPKEERSDVVLTITYSNISLGVTLLTRKAFEYSWGAMWPQSVSEAFDLGRDVPLREQEPEKYWREIENVILGTIRDAERVDNIIFLGSQGGDEELRKVVREVMDGHGEREAVATDTRNAQESLFITARGSAAAARRGMIDGFDGCLMPNYCEMDDGKSEL